MMRALWTIGLAGCCTFATCARADVLAYWRFEDHPAGDKLEAKTGTEEPPLTTTRSIVDPPNPLRTYNTRPDIAPPDTSGTFIAPTDLPTLAGGVVNTRCVRFIGHEDFYTAVMDGQVPPIHSSRLPRFTVEGLFKLSVLSAGNRDEYQAVVAKDGRPASRLRNQPFVAVVAGRDDELVKRDCLAIHIIDHAGSYRTAASQKPLRRDHWYAFAAACDGPSLKLFINRFDGRGYQLEAETSVEDGLIDSTDQWTVGRGMIDQTPNSWFQGCIDEVRISDEALPPARWLMAGIDELPAAEIAPAAVAPRPTQCVAGLADPSVLLHDGVYYLYGTYGKTKSLGVWTSPDLKTWTKGPTLLHVGPGVWGDDDFWAPDVIEHGGKFYLYYSSSGVLPYAGGPRSARINIAVADSPTGPFKEIVPRLPLLGRAVIDPQVFVDDDGSAYLYFVGDVSEGPGQIYVARLAEDLVSIVGEPVKCIERSQPWEGPTWNEGPFVFRDGDTYVLMYSGEFWASPNYAVGFATAPTPLGPWKKYDDNPILYRYGGLTGTGHNSLVKAPGDDGWLIFFHAHRSVHESTRDTYFARLKLERDARDSVVLKVEPWKARQP